MKSEPKFCVGDLIRTQYAAVAPSMMLIFDIEIDSFKETFDAYYAFDMSDDYSVVKFYETSAIAECAVLISRVE